MLGNSVSSFGLSQPPKNTHRSNAPGSDDSSSIGSSNSLPEGDDEYFPYLTADDCSELDRHCPISQLDMEGMAEPAATEAVSESVRSGYY